MYSFKASLSKESVSYDQSNGALKIKVLAVVPETRLPLRDESGEAVLTFAVSEALIKGAVDTFRGGVFNVDHKSIPESIIGTFDSAVYNGGYLASGSILCPEWKERILAGNYSGVSVEGAASGSDLSNPDGIFIYAISFLTKEENPQGGACPLGANEEGKPACEVSVLEGSKVEAASAETVDNDELTIEAVWSPNYESYWRYIEDGNGKISQSKAKKIFLKKTGTGENRTDWHYPIAKMTENGPVSSEDGLMAAYKRAAQQGETGLLGKIRSKMRSIGMEIPPGLKASKATLEASFNEKENKFSARAIDEDGEIVSEKEILVISANEGETRMPEEVKEVPAVAAAASEAEASTQAAPAASEVQVPAAVVSAPEVVPTVGKTIDWELVKQELGIGSKEEFVQLKNSAVDIQSKLDKVLKENEDLKGFKIETHKKYLKDTYPPALWDGEGKLDAFYQEYVKDPLSFGMRYNDEAVKFAASKSVKLAGSAAPSELTEEAKRELEVKGAVDHIRRRTGYKR